MNRRVALIIGLAALVAVPLAFGQEGSESKPEKKSMMDHAKERMTGAKYHDIHGRPGNGPAEGTVAPDFDLQPLKFYELGIDDTEITEETAGLLYENVRLSDFKDHKPVVLIFGSYT